MNWTCFSYGFIAGAIFVVAATVSTIFIWDAMISRVEEEEESDE